MNVFELALLIGAFITLLISWRLPRAALWIALGGLDYLVSSLWWYAGLRFHPFATLCCDFLMVASIYHMAKQRWELGLFITFQLSMLASVLKMFLAAIGTPITNLAYAQVLEAINWVALLIIGGTAIIGWLGEPYVGRVGIFATGRWRSAIVAINQSLRKTRPSGLKFYQVW